MPEQLTALVIEDDPIQRETLCDVLASVCTIASAGDSAEAINIAERSHPSVVISDLVLPGDIDGLALLRWFNANMPDVPVILITGHATVETALDAMKSGAYDYLVKPVDIQRLRAVTQKALERYQIAAERRRLKEVIEGDASLCGLVGVSSPMREVFRKINAVAQIDTTVLIAGESGTGKELVAEAIHKLSGRKGALVKVNCSAIPENLLESELFGYEKGAFTGANANKPGKFDIADKGTLLLDEIGEMSLPLQSKLLRAIESGEIEPLGATKPHNINVRIVAATNQDLLKLIEAGKFREDLYFRLRVFPIVIPPLRERKEDIPLFISHFLRQISEKLGKRIIGISKPVMDALLNYHWSGNVRQLRNALEEMAILATGEELDNLPLSISEFPQRTNVPDELKPIEQLEREAILRAMKETDGNKTRAAMLLGIGLRTLYRKLKQIDNTK